MVTSRRNETWCLWFKTKCFILVTCCDVIGLIHGSNLGSFHRKCTRKSQYTQQIYKYFTVVWFNVKLNLFSGKRCWGPFLICLLFTLPPELPFSYCLYLTSMYRPVWPDWAIYWTLGNFLKPLGTINLSKSPIFLGNFCKGIKFFDFFSEIIFGQLL